MQYVYIYSIFYFIVVALTQMSVLFFYRRIFLPSHLRYTSIALAALSGAVCLIATIIEIGYPGHPIDYFFPGTASVHWNVVYLPFWLAMGIIEGLIDVVILVLPIRELHKLNLSTDKKLYISLIFMLGGFVVITGIVRLAALYRPGIVDFDLTIGDIWLNVHLGTAIISACLPAYRPLVLRGFRSSRDAYHSDDTHTLTAEKWKIRGPRSRQFVEEIPMGQRLEHQGSFVNARRSESNDTTRRPFDEDGAIKAGAAIGVRKTIEVV